MTCEALGKICADLLWWFVSLFFLLSKLPMYALPDLAVDFRGTVENNMYFDKLPHYK